MEYMNRPWYVKDESHDRPGFCCLAIRETGSRRLVADLADVPDEVPDFIERAWDEARLLAASPKLFEVCKTVIAWHEKMNTSDNVYDIALPDELATQLYDAIASAEGRIEESYGGVIEEELVASLPVRLPVATFLKKRTDGRSSPKWSFRAICCGLEKH